MYYADVYIQDLGASCRVVVRNKYVYWWGNVTLRLSGLVGGALVCWTYSTGYPSSNPEKPLEQLVVQEIRYPLIEFIDCTYKLPKSHVVTSLQFLVCRSSKGQDIDTTSYGSYLRVYDNEESLALRILVILLTMAPAFSHILMCENSLSWDVLIKLPMYRWVIKSNILSTSTHFKCWLLTTT